MNKDPPALLPKRKNLILSAAGTKMGERFLFHEPVDHPQLFLLRHFPHADLHEETIQLRFGKRKCTQCFHRVLRGDDEKRILQYARCAVHGNLTLRHTFKQRRLCTRRGAVDLIRKKNVAKNRSRPEHKL